MNTEGFLCRSLNEAVLGGSPVRKLARYYVGRFGNPPRAEKLKIKFMRLIFVIMLLYFSGCLIGQILDLEDYQYEFPDTVI